MSESVELPDAPWLLPRLWALFLILLVAVTYRMWFVFPTSADVPRVPLLDHDVELTDFVSVAPSIAMIVGLVLVVAAPRRFRQWWWVISGSLLLSFLVDQHRLQPWAYQSAIYGLIFATMDRQLARRWLIPLAASVYLYSAAGKLDFQFVHTVGQDFLDAIAGPLGGLPANWGPSVRAKIALVLPTTELLAGIGLLFRTTRPSAAVVVIMIHVSLIGMLGPWSLNHSTGVLVWNVLLIVQAYLLLWKPDPPIDATRLPKSGEKHTSAAIRVVQAIVVVVLVAPLLERSGYWDHWSSWSLYSPHTSRVQIEIHRSAIDSLDPLVRPYLDDDVDGDGWSELATDRWSLDSRGAPIYPQARYQLALAAAIAKRHQLTDEIRVCVNGTSDRFTGRRDKQRMLGRREIIQGLRSYWLTR